MRASSFSHLILCTFYILISDFARLVLLKVVGSIFLVSLITNKPFLFVFV